MQATQIDNHLKTLKNNWDLLSSRLQKQLTHFGLNPKDWTLVLNSRQRIRRQIEIDLINGSDKDYCLKGIAGVTEFSIHNHNNHDHFYSAFWKEIHGNLKF